MFYTNRSYRQLFGKTEHISCNSPRTSVDRTLAVQRRRPSMSVAVKRDFAPQKSCVLDDSAQERYRVWNAQQKTILRARTDERESGEFRSRSKLTERSA